MTDDSGGDGDRLLRLAGVALVVGILAALGVMAAAFAAGPGGNVEAAETVWRLDQVNDTHARLVHVDGPSVSGDDLVVTVDSLPRDQVDPPSIVGRNDSVVIRARSDQVVRLFYDAGRGDSTLLGAWRPNR